MEGDERLRSVNGEHEQEVRVRLASAKRAKHLCHSFGLRHRYLQPRLWQTFDLNRRQIYLQLWPAFDSKQRRIKGTPLKAPLPPRSKAVKAVFTHLWTPVNCVSKVFLWYAFACCQKRVKGVSKFVCDSSQRFAKGVVEDTCDTGQRFVKGASRVPRSHLSPELLARAPRSRCATVHRVPHLLRFSCFLDWLFSSVYERCNNIRTLVLCLTSFGGIYQFL